MKMIHLFIREYLDKIAEKDKNVYFIFIDGFRIDWGVDLYAKYPDRVISAGISEQNAFSIATGLALSGKKVYLFLLAAYATHRALDQLKMASYSNADINIITNFAGLGAYKAGYSHLTVDDLSVLRNTPNLKVFNPATENEIKAVMDYTYQEKSPVYVRIEDGGYMEQGDTVNLSKYTCVRRGCSKCVIIACGQTVHRLCDNNFYKQFLEKGICPTITSAVQPCCFDTECLKRYVKKGYLIVSVEAHGSGGLSASIAEVLVSLKKKAKYVPVYIRDENFRLVGSSLYAIEKYLKLSSLPKLIADKLHPCKLIKIKCKFKGDKTKIRYKLFGIPVITKVILNQKVKTYLFGFLRVGTCKI